MSYTSSRHQAPKPRGPNPLLRGLGFLLLIGFLVGGYFAEEWFFAENAKQGWIYIPSQLAGPAFAPMLFAKVVFVALVMVIGFAILTIVYGIINPVRPGELDAPPPRPSGRKSR